MKTNSIFDSLGNSQRSMNKNNKKSPNIVALWNVFTKTNETMNVMEYISSRHKNKYRAQIYMFWLTNLLWLLFNRYVITELLQSDLHKIIVSPQHLSADHIKVFLYQILRGLKYLHSARILHRDIKPGNLLVNSNCVLKVRHISWNLLFEVCDVNVNLFLFFKICDFGLARVEEPDSSKHMTQEVVTQYYRAPEILMGARHYSASVDVWSVGCIFGELLGRRILFQAQSPVQQVS